MNGTKKHPRIPHTKYKTPGDIIEVYEDELAVLVTNHVRPDLNQGEKVTFYRAGVYVYPQNSATPGKKEKYFHFRVYRP